MACNRWVVKHVNVGDLAFEGKMAFCILNLVEKR